MQPRLRATALQGAMPELVRVGRPSASDLTYRPPSMSSSWQELCVCSNMTTLFCVEWSRGHQVEAESRQGVNKGVSPTTPGWGRWGMGGVFLLPSQR